MIWYILPPGRVFFALQVPGGVQYLLRQVLPLRGCAGSFRAWAWQCVMLPHWACIRARRLLGFRVCLELGCQIWTQRCHPAHFGVSHCKRRTGCHTCTLEMLLLHPCGSQSVSSRRFGTIGSGPLKHVRVISGYFRSEHELEQSGTKSSGEEEDVIWVLLISIKTL